MREILNQKSVYRVDIVARSNYAEITTGIIGPNAASDVILIEEEKLDEFIQKFTIIKNQIKKTKNEIKRKHATSAV